MIEIRKLSPQEILVSARLIALGMLENPIHSAVWSDASIREKALLCTFAEGQRAAAKWALGLFEGEHLRGVAGVGVHFGEPLAAPASGLLNKLAEIDAPAADRYLAWRAAWARHEPSKEHWHFGPFAVDPERRRQGLGGRLLTAFCEMLDANGVAGYLEADRSDNVPLYERHGFHVVADDDVLGVHTWYMCRDETRNSS